MMSGNTVESCDNEFARRGVNSRRSPRVAGRHRRAKTATATAATDMTPSAHILQASDTPANSAPRRERRRRGALRPALTGGIAVLGAAALVGTFVTPAPAEARATTYAVSAPTPTPLLAALALPFDPAQLEAAARAAIDIDLDGVFRFNSDLVDLLARLGASLRVDVDIDAEEIAASFAELINAIALDIDGGIAAVNGVVNLGAALVSEIATAAALAGVDGVDAIAGALVSLLAAITPEGGVAGDLSAAIGLAIGDIGDLIASGFIGAGSAVTWKATLDDLLVDLVAAGGIALTNGVAGSLAALLTGSAELPNLPDIDGEDVVLALGNLAELFADGINGGLLTAGGAVELGVSVIGDLARALAEAGVGVRADITAALLGAFDAPEAVVDLVADISSGIDAGIRGFGEAVAWKFLLDDVLVDVGVAGGVSLVNGLTAALFGAAGLPIPDLPDVDFAASVRALINHFAVALGIDLDLDVDAGVDVDLGNEEGGDEAGADVDVDADADVDVDGAGQIEGLTGGFDAQRAGVFDESDADADLISDGGEQASSVDGDDDELADSDLGDVDGDLEQVEGADEDSGAGDSESEGGDAGDGAEGGDTSTDTGTGDNPGGGDTGSPSPTE